MNRTLAVLTLFTATLVSAQTKKAMEVEAFDFSTVMTTVQAVFGTQVNIGQGIQSMMVKRIATDGKYTVVERRKVENIMKEQDFNASNRVKKGSGARVGQIRGADLTLLGDIVVFGRDDRRKSGVVGAIVPGAGGIIGGSKSDAKAVVVLDYRLVDTETSEVVASGEARGESKRSSKSFGAAMFAGGALVGGGFSSSASNFGETIIGEAVMAAVDKLALDLSKATLNGGAGGKELDLDARVADVTGNTITINAGSSAGLAAGQTFTIFHKGKEIKDPTTGEVLDVQTTPLGTFTVTNVRDRITMGTFAGSGTPAVGDIVRKQ